MPAIESHMPIAMAPAGAVDGAMASPPVAIAPLLAFLCTAALCVVVLAFIRSPWPVVSVDIWPYFHRRWCADTSQISLCLLCAWTGPIEMVHVNLGVLVSRARIISAIVDSLCEWMVHVRLWGLWAAVVNECVQAWLKAKALKAWVSTVAPAWLGCVVGPAVILKPRGALDQNQTMVQPRVLHCASILSASLHEH